jgi:hypothetical protein
MRLRPTQIAQDLLERALDPIDVSDRMVGPDTPSQPLLFILGAPRCGSTLLFQSLVEHFDVAYMANVHHVLRGSPALVERIVRPRRWRRPSDYRSRFGHVGGLTAPSEAGSFWYRFFRKRPHHADLADVSPADRVRLRRSLRAFERACGRPIVIKNLFCSLRVGVLGEVLPEARFVVLHRDLLDNAHSILEARHRLHGNYDSPFSLTPPGMEAFAHAPPEVQVLEQIQRTYRFIDERRAQVGEARFLDLRYEDFCANPEATLERVGRFVTAPGHAPLTIRAPAPTTFATRGEVRIDRDLYARLREQVARRSAAPQT